MSGECPTCREPVQWCVCPPLVFVSRPSIRDTYPPLYCVICAKPSHAMTPVGLKMFAANITCSEACREEYAYRYYNGTVLNLPYGRKHA